MKMKRNDNVRTALIIMKLTETIKNLAPAYVIKTPKTIQMKLIYGRYSFQTILSGTFLE